MNLDLAEIMDILVFAADWVFIFFEYFLKLLKTVNKLFRLHVCFAC